MSTFEFASALLPDAFDLLYGANRGQQLLLQLGLFCMGCQINLCTLTSFHDCSTFGNNTLGRIRFHLVEKQVTRVANGILQIQVPLLHLESNLAQQFTFHLYSEIKIPFCFTRLDLFLFFCIISPPRPLIYSLKKYECYFIMMEV